MLRQCGAPFNRPNGRNRGFGQYPLLLRAFNTTFDVVIAEKEIHTLVAVLLLILHYTSICWCSSGYMVLDNLCRAFFFVSTWSAKQAFADFFGSLAMCHPMTSQLLSWIDDT